MCVTRNEKYFYEREKSQTRPIVKVIWEREFKTFNLAWEEKKKNIVVTAAKYFSVRVHKRRQSSCIVPRNLLLERWLFLVFLLFFFIIYISWVLITSQSSKIARDVLFLLVHSLRSVANKKYFFLELRRKSSDNLDHLHTSNRIYAYRV